MTPKEIDAMPAGREMDALVAEKVMGEICNCGCDAITVAVCRVHCARTYSASISAAWEVVEKFASIPSPEGWGRFDLGDRVKDGKITYYAQFYDYEKQGETEYADTAPLAICRAALKAHAR